MAQRLRETTDENSNRPSPNGPLSELLRDGFLAAWPICLSYMPLGLAFGVTAAQAGLSAFEIGLMSLIVYGGAAQFIAVSMLAARAPIPAILVAASLVNLRYLLMSSALAGYLKRLSKPGLAFFSWGITDGTFLVNVSRFAAGGWRPGHGLVVNIVPQAVWTLGSIAGAGLGQTVPVGAAGLDFALPALFISLLVSQARHAASILTAASAGLAALALSRLLPGHAYVLLGAVVGATLGRVVQSFGRRRT